MWFRQPWFLGVEQLLLGHATPYFLRLAQIAAVARLCHLQLHLAAMLFLYQRFERGDLSAGQRIRSVSSTTTCVPPVPRETKSATAAIGPFIRATLTRSPLHQGVFVIIAACGAGLVLNSFVGNWHAGALSNADDPLIATVIWAPFALVFAMNVALRAALVLPIELRANWIFRMTEDEATRAEELSAVVRTLILLGVVVPLAVFFPRGVGGAGSARNPLHVDCVCAASCW